MSVLTRRLLLALMILVQCIAPLVHAHVGRHLPGGGIHLPGLEGGWGFKAGSALLQATQGTFNENNLVVGIDLGIKVKDLSSQSSIDDSDTVYFCPLLAIFTPLFSTPVFIPALYAQPIQASIAHTPYVSRAPPFPL